MTKMNKATELVVGGVVGAIASQVLELLIKEARIVWDFKAVSKELATTMADLLPIIKKIESLQKREELKTLMDTIDEAKVLVKKCSEVKWWAAPQKSYYTRKVWKIQKKMVSFCQVQLQLIQHGDDLQSTEDIKKLDIMMISIKNNLEIVTKKLDDLMDAMMNNHQILTEKLDNTHQIVTEMHQVMNPTTSNKEDLCSVLKLGKTPVGFDWPLDELKDRLLDDSVDCLVVYGDSGRGKTTLITQLCHDRKIKGKFAHIFFNKVSSTPNFRKLVQNLLKHNGQAPPTFDDHYQASIALYKLLKKLTEDGPILMVLDDVWSGGESLLHKFRFNLPDYKILVTSRSDFPSFGSSYELKPLDHEDARALLIQWAPRPPNESEAEYEDLLKKILKHCKGVPIVIKVQGKSLKGPLNTWKDQVESWSTEETVLDSVQGMQPTFNALDPNLKECFLDMDSILEKQKIYASVIIDIWVELYGKGSSSSSSMYMKYLTDLDSQELLKLIPLGRKEPEDGFYNDFLVTQLDALRELASSQSELEAILEIRRLNLKIIEDTFPDWCLNLEKPINARLLSISTDDLFSSNWVELDFPNVEALVLNISSSNYALPSFIETMEKLKVVIIINHEFYPERLNNFPCLSKLRSLKRIRLEKVSITFLDMLRLQRSSLSKISLVMCRFGEISHDTKGIDVSKALPSLQEIDIDYCYDLVELPFWISEVVSLKTLSITNCNKFSILPEAIGNLSNLETLRLISCTNLSELPETTAELNNLRFLDISGCFQLEKLPLEIGNLQKLKKISMRDCYRCNLPDSVMNLENLEVKCDEGTVFLWKRFKPKMKNLTITEEETEHNLNFLQQF